MLETSRGFSSWPHPISDETVESKLDQILELLKKLSDTKEVAPQILTKEEASEILKGSNRHLSYLLYEKKRLPYFMVKGEVRIRMSDLIEYIENQIRNKP